MTKRKSSNNRTLPTCILLGLICGLSVLSNTLNPVSFLIFNIASAISIVFINLLQLISLPIIFTAIVNTISGLKDFDELKTIGAKVLRYTMITTLIAASVSLMLVVILDPANSVNHVTHTTSETSVNLAENNYLDHLAQVVPSNFVQTFSDNNVIGILIIATSLGLAILSLPPKKQSVLHDFFSSAYAAIFQITVWILKLVPIAIWAFMALFIRDLIQGDLQMGFLSTYLLCVIGANLIQAGIILPGLLVLKGIAPMPVLRSMMPALQVAFWSKSSSSALPVAISNAVEANIPKRIANIALPLCITINMNACAAFILITVLFVSGSEGLIFSAYELIAWILIATIAAVGNAGVPMGCFFLSGALLTSLNIPLDMMGYILPFYMLIDMLESAINVWSDACVTFSVAQDLKEEKTNTSPSLETPNIS